MQDNKRTLYFMGGTVLAGLLLVVGMYIFDYIQKPKTEGGGGITLTGTDNHKELQRKIDLVNIKDKQMKKIQKYEYLLDYFHYLMHI